MFKTHCEVRVFSHSTFDIDGFDGFIKSEGLPEFDFNVAERQTDADTLPEIAGRICYMSFVKPRPGGNKAYIERILQQGHGSVLEHATIGVIITGISRSCSHELVRHRVGFSYSQLSQRYVDSKDVSFIIPHEMQKADNHYALIQFKDLCHDARNRYADLTVSLSKSETRPTTEDLKRARQAARSVLPNATETKLVMTGNVRAWRHFIELRSGVGAEPEIRKLTKALYDVFVTVAPQLFADYVWHEIADGTHVANTMYRKV